MSQKRSFSPYARGYLHRRFLTFGIIMTLIASLIHIAMTPSSISEFLVQLAAVSMFFPIGWIGILFLLIGVWGEVKARRFDKKDWQLADAIATEFERLVASPTDRAYPDDGDIPWVRSAAIGEVERHFDQQTAGSITGELRHRFSLSGGMFASGFSKSGFGGAFGGLVRGLSNVDLKLDTTTRSNLMGDALFAVLDIKDANGNPDTVRIISMSGPAVREWIASILDGIAFRLNGNRTHAGATIYNYRSAVINKFTPMDTSYVTDQVKMAARHGNAEIKVKGPWIGRNAMLVSTMSVGSKEPLFVYPLGAPEMIMSSIAQAVTATQQLESVSPMPELEKAA